MTVATVAGEVQADRLGVTLMHEHIFVLEPEVDVNYPGAWDEDVEMRRATEQLREAEERGVSTIVDLTVIGLGRYLPRIQVLAEATTINIVAATGVYTYDELPRYFSLRGPGLLMDGEPLVEMFVKDLTEGIADTGVRAGVLKCVSDAKGLTPGVERALRATAKAHLETGALVNTHSDAHTEGGLEQQRIFREEGVDLERVVIGHCGDSTDLDYLRRLMDAGSTIGMDRFGLDILLPFDARVQTLAELCRQGYAERMVLSHDTSCFTGSIDREVRERVVPNWRYTHIFDDVLPALLDAGVTQAQIDQMLVRNPAALLPRR